MLSPANLKRLEKSRLLQILFPVQHRDLHPHQSLSAVSALLLLRMPFALCLIAMLAGCGPSAAVKEPLARQLPPPPSWTVPVKVPEPKRGEYALAVAARERAARFENADRLIEFRDWYTGLRVDLGGGAVLPALEGEANQ